MYGTGADTLDGLLELPAPRRTEMKKMEAPPGITGALANLGHRLSDQTVGNILKRYGIPTAPERKKTTTWPEFIRSHTAVLAATDFFTTEVWTPRGLVTYYVLFVMHVATRRVHIAGLTPSPDERWMTQIARNITMAEDGKVSAVDGPAIVVSVSVRGTGMKVHHACVLVAAAFLVGIGALHPVTGLHAQTSGEVRAQELGVRAEQGDAVAEYTLGLMYADGDGVEKSDVEALSLLIRAVSHAFGEDYDVYAEMRDALTARMTAEDVAEARRRASEWEPTEP